MPGPVPTSTKQHLARLITNWPKDLVRPQAISVQTYLQSRLKALPEPPEDSARFSKANVNALYSLLDNRYQKAYPLSRFLRYPASQPQHYDALMEEFREAPNRDFWGRLGKKIKGMFRMQ
ncbi:hypothetical protein AAP_00101 [Ascosphaera apis ARSEF 7405]|uniref:Uncharacterized protein n=1 Tax=Ascosphaera apis ARSEF 7405 TaxID=392613 RepID=A0A166PML5_9EURO|nr:hypothetical protein AAP_00101 [Ascosphaera apis ARSEF 7405]